MPTGLSDALKCVNINLSITPRKLKRLLRERGMDPSAVAANAGFGVSTLRNYADGRTGMSDGKVKRLAELLKVDVDEIEGYEPQCLKEESSSYRANTNALEFLTDLELHTKATAILADADLEIAERARRAMLFLEELAKRKAPP